MAKKQPKAIKVKKLTLVKPTPIKLNIKTRIPRYGRKK